MMVATEKSCSGRAQAFLQRPHNGGGVAGAGAGAGAGGVKRGQTYGAGLGSLDILDDFRVVGVCDSGRRSLDCFLFCFALVSTVGEEGEGMTRCGGVLLSTREYPSRNCVLSSLVQF
jgi:hypothetical protein